MPLRGQRAGALDRRVTVQSIATTLSDAGDQTLTPTTLFTAWASYSPVTGGEQFKAGQRLATETGIFRFRWRSDWTPDPGGHQLVYNGKTWDITYVTEVGRRDAYELTAEVRGTSGGG